MVKAVQIAGINVWNAIQTSNLQLLADTLSEDFEAKGVGEINGVHNHYTFNKEQMVATAASMGKVAEAIVQVKFTNYFSKDEDGNDIYCIRYKQRLVINNNGGTPPVMETSAMHSKGLQKWHWVLQNSGDPEKTTAIFTKMEGWEVDTITPLKKDEIPNKVEVINKLISDGLCNIL